jgi:DNA-directed RNA polymerase subunit RPC12/RpoP
MSQEPAPSLLLATGQNRILRNSGIAFFAGVGIMYLARAPFIAELHPAALYIVATFGALVSAAGSLAALRLVRCPKCGLRWFQWSLGHRPVQDYLHWMYRFSECPGCAYRGQ